MKRDKIWLVLKGILSYCMKYGTYMTVWTVVLLFGGIFVGIKEKSFVIFTIQIILIFIPAMIKKILLMISRIGGSNRYDEKMFGRGPRGRFINYLEEYLKNI